MLKAKKLIAAVIATMGMGALGVAANGSTANADTIYTVKSGDTLSSIAQTQLGDANKYTEIANENGITDVDNISVGQTLRIGGTTSSSNATQSSVATTVTLPQTSVQQTNTNANTQSNVNNSYKETNTQSVQKDTYTQPTQSYNTGAQATAAKTNTSSSASVGSAGEQIAQAESGGDYNARNGQYIGKYQLSASYLNGDYSPENQDRTFVKYCNDRYGSVEGALNFRQSHGWY